MTTPLQGIREHEQEQNYDYSPSSSSSFCSCFNFCWPKTRKYSNLTAPPDQSQVTPDSWFVEKVKKVKETAEAIAGPEFKTFVRKVGGYINKHKQRNNNSRVQYDAYSYALNFDSGPDDDDDEYDETVGFSRFPATPLLDGRKESPARAGKSELL
ncbi:hypothetical protein ACFE04_001632 [Oxalis oulophora]